MLNTTIPEGKQAPGDLGARIEFLIVAIAVFLLPLNYFRLDTVYVTLGDIFLLLAFALMVVRKRIPLRPFGAASGLWFASLFVFLLGFMVSSIVNGNALEAATIMVQYCVSLVVLPLVVLRRTRRETELLVLTFVLSVAVAMLHGTYYVKFVEGQNDFVSGSGRLKGLFERQTEAGVISALSIVLLIWLRMIGRVSPFLFVILFIPLAYGLLLTGSNSGFFLATIGAILFVLLIGSLPAFAKLLIGLVVFFFAALTYGENFLPEIFLKRVFQAFRDLDISESGTFDDRMLLIIEAMRLGNDTIWVGLGLGQYPAHSAYQTSVHNTYLLVLNEGGLISLIGLAGIFATCLFVIFQNRMFEGNRENISISFVVTLMMFVVLHSAPHFYARFWMLPWILALSASLVRDLPVRRRSLSVPARKWNAPPARSP